MNYYLEVWKQYAVFNGRARGKEFWFFFLINLIVVAILETIGMMISGSETSNLTTGLTGIYTLAVLLPIFGVTVRRLHDTDKSGWLVLLCLIPVVGNLIVLIMCAMPGTVGDNQYGPDPVAGGITTATA